MKLVNLKKFLLLPRGTLFTRFPLGCHELLIKEDNVTDGPDFWQQGFSNTTGAIGRHGFYEPLTHRRPSDKSFDLSLKFVERSTEFDEKDLYIVYEAADVKMIMARLTQACQHAGIDLT